MTDHGFLDFKNYIPSLKVIYINEEYLPNAEDKYTSF